MFSYKNELVAIKQLDISVCVNYYIIRITPIYQNQSLYDPLMSQSFDIFFQTKDNYYFSHVPNTQDEP